MIAYVGILVLAAVLIAFWIWIRGRWAMDYLQRMSNQVVYDQLAADEWERPRIVPLGGIHDVEQDEWV